MKIYTLSLTFLAGWVSCSIPSLLLLVNPIQKQWDLPRHLSGRVTTEYHESCSQRGGPKGTPLLSMDVPGCVVHAFGNVTVLWSLLKSLMKLGKPILSSWVIRLCYLSLSLSVFIFASRATQKILEQKKRLKTIHGI